VLASPAMYVIRFGSESRGSSTSVVQNGGVTSTFVLLSRMFSTFSRLARSIFWSSVPVGLVLASRMQLTLISTPMGVRIGVEDLDRRAFRPMNLGVQAGRLVRTGAGRGRGRDFSECLGDEGDCSGVGGMASSKDIRDIETRDASRHVSLREGSHRSRSSR